MGSRGGIFSVRDHWGGGSLAGLSLCHYADSGIRTVSRQRVSFWDDGQGLRRILEQIMGQR